MKPTLHKLRLLWYFQRRLLVPTAGIALGIGVAGAGFTFMRSLAFGFLVAGPLIHFMLYTVAESSDRFFYYNFGITRLELWCSTITINTIICVCLLMI